MALMAAVKKIIVIILPWIQNIKKFETVQFKQTFAFEHITPWPSLPCHVIESEQSRINSNVWTCIQEQLQSRVLWKSC